jgi:hypothetical protein
MFTFTILGLFAASEGAKRQGENVEGNGLQNHRLWPLVSRSWIAGKARPKFVIFGK